MAKKPTTKSAAPPLPENLLRPARVSELLGGVPVQTLSYWRKLPGKNGLPYVKIGRHVYYEPAAVRAFIEAHRRGAA